MHVYRIQFILWIVLGLVLSSCSVPKDEALSQSLLDGITSGTESTSDTYLLTAETITSTKVKLTWHAPQDVEVAGYAIYDVTNKFEPKIILTVVDPKKTSDTITDLTPQDYYLFRVRSYDSKQVEDKNVVDKAAIPYGGVLSAEVQNSTSALIKYNPAANADKVLVYCKVGQFALLETLIKTENNTSLEETKLEGLTPGETYTCRVAIERRGFVDNNKVTTSFIPLGAATQLVFTNQPGSATAGTVLPSQPIVKIQDSSGNVIMAGPDATAQVTLIVATASPSAGTILGTATVNAVKGVATFTGLKFNESGIKVLTATKADTSAQLNGAGVLTADSAQFTISPGPVSSTTSTIATNPTPPAPDLVADGSAYYTVVINLKDQYGNPVSGIKPQFASSISGDNLTQPSANTNASGQSTGSIKTTIADSLPPFRLLSITSPSGLTSITTPAHFVPGPANKLGFVVQPVNSPSGPLQLATIKVAVQDVNGNTITTGTGSGANITMNINSNTNGATLSGTTSVPAVNGVATFGDLGIDKSMTGYKLQASSGSYISAYSNSFNVTSGTPVKISVTSPSNSVLSSAQASTPRNCSQAITVKLLDSGNNPANAVQNTTLQVTGLGSAILYGNPTCSGVALTSSLTITAGANIKTIYLLDPAGESITISIRDSSNVLTTGTFVMNVLPNKIGIAAKMPSPPAAPNTDMTVTAGVCSPALVVTPTGENNNPAPIFSPTMVSLTGLTAASALFYTDSACTQAVTASSISLPITAGTGNYKINLYTKDLKSEVITLNISDPLAAMTTTSSNQTITVLPAAIGFTGPSSVVAGKCSTAFRVSLKDAQGNAAIALTNTVLNINGLAGSSTGYFFTSNSCTGTGFKNQLTIPQNNSYIDIYFSDTTAESLNVYISDPSAGMTNSPTLPIGISPAGLSITTPLPAYADTSVCSSAFTVNTMDGASIPNITAAIQPITVNLAVTGYATGFSAAGAFYSDAACTNSVTSLTFQNGESAKNFYFIGQYPAANGSLTITASDSASVLTSGTANWGVTAKKAWLGTKGKVFDENGDLIWFRTGVKPVSSRMDSASSIWDIHFDATKRYLYVVDVNGGKILKYDYTNQKYIGWIGGFSNPFNIAAPISGSNKSTEYPNLPTTALCKQTQSGQVTPGWCVGGQSYVEVTRTDGVLGHPRRITDDGTYLYVVMSSDRIAQNRNHIVARFDAESGAFAGWIGGVYTGGTPSEAAAGGPSTCSTMTAPGVTPGWCLGGVPTWNASYSTGWGFGMGAMTDPLSITSDSTFIYVGQWGAVLKYTKSTGAFAGWIGKADNLSPTGPGVGGVAGCTTLSSGQTTPGWCMGGKFQTATSGANMQAGAIYNPRHLYVDSTNDILYVLDQGYYSGLVNQYRASTGAYLGRLSGLGLNWNGTYSFVQDATSGNFYFADYNRVLATDATGVVQAWLGKVSSNAGISDALGNTSGQCASLLPNNNTPGWCLGGTAKAGMDDTSFVQLYAIESDGQGNLLVAQQSDSSIKKINMNTGVYSGSLVASSDAPLTWSNDANTQAEYYGYGDRDFNSPSGLYTDSQYMYVSDYNNGRVKKISLATGALVGWVGAVTSTPTGGIAPGCLTTNPMSTVNSWCLGSLPSPWNQITNFTNSSSQNGILQAPNGVVGDGSASNLASYIYVVDRALHRINKFNAVTGAFVGWIGQIATTPTGGDSGCTDSANLAAPGKFTPGWCTGGTSTSGTGDGSLNAPTSVTYVANTGYLYVVDEGNHRISSYDPITGAFKGWIGRISTNPTSGCTYAANGSGYSVVTSGWCKGGTSSRGVSLNNGATRDRGGAFDFWQAGATNPGITSDGTYLYVSNTFNTRIDKFCLVGCANSAQSGSWVGATPSSPGVYTEGWSTTPSDMLLSKFSSGSVTMGLWSDANYLYLATGGWWGYVISKINKSTGFTIGWQGTINPSSSPSGGDSGCAGATGTTPGWCQGGGAITGYKMGGFSAASGITGDNNFIYVSDINLHRVTRIPK